MNAPAEELRQAASLLRNLIRRPELAGAVDLPYTEPLADLREHHAAHCDAVFAAAEQVWPNDEGQRAEFIAWQVSTPALAVARAINGEQR